MQPDSVVNHSCLWLQLYRAALLQPEGLIFGESGASGGGCLCCALFMNLSQLSARARDMMVRQGWEGVILLLQGPVRQNRGWDEGWFLLAEANYQLGRLAEAFP